MDKAKNQSVVSESQNEEDIEGMEEGEFELTEEEGGEDQLEESSDDQIDYNHNPEKIEEPAEASDSESEEEDIIQSTIKKKQDMLKNRESARTIEELEREVHNKDRKKQKVGQEEEQPTRIKQVNLDKDLDQVKEFMAPPEKENKQMEVDFEYVAPCEPYYHIVRTFLTQYLDGPEQENLDISSMADHILERASIGSVIASSLGTADPDKNPAYEKLSDEEFNKIALRLNATRDVYGFITILSLSRMQEKLNWMNYIHKYVLAKAELNCKAQHLQLFKETLQKSNVGLLVNERLVNMPANVVPKLHSELPLDLAFTKEQDDITDPKEFDYDYLLVLTKFTVPNESVVKDQAPKRDDRLYYRWEDDVFEAKASVSFFYQRTFKEVGDDGTKSYIQGANAQAGGGKETQYGLIYLIKMKDYEEQLPILQRLVKEPKLKKRK